MFIADLLLAIPWVNVGGAATLLAGMALIAAGLRYDRAVPTRSRSRREDGA